MNTKKLLTTILTLFFMSSMTFAADIWQAVGDVGFSDGAITYGSIVVDGNGTPSVAYVDGGSGGAYSEYARVRTFNGSAWVNAAPNAVSPMTTDNYVYNTSLAINSSGNLYVAFKDYEETGKISVRNISGGSWSNLGFQGFTPGTVEYISLAIDGSGTAYVAYEDGANGSKASVMKRDGYTWVNVGIAGFSEGSANYTSLAIDASGTPYVAYKDNANSYKVTVMKYNGSSWVNVGTAGFSAGYATSISLKIDGSGTPYVAYKDNVNGAKATVMKYDGGAWVVVGTAGFSTAAAHFTSLAIDDNDSLYVAFQDRSTADQKATVMKFDGSSWRILGPANFSAGQVEHLSLAVTGTGTPYMVYRDNGNGGKTTVMKFLVTDDPVVINNEFLTLDEGATAVIDSSLLLTTDGDTDAASLAYTVTGPPWIGELKLSGTTTTTFTQADINNGLVTYTHDGSENFAVWFTFVVSDGIYQTASQQFSFSVTAVNDVPTIVVNDRIVLNPGVITASIDSTVLQADDQETSQGSLIFTITALPSNGTLQNNGVDIALNGTFNQSDLFNDLITYTYDGSGAVSDEFTFSVGDGTDELTGQVFDITIIDVAWEVLGTVGFSGGKAFNTSIAIDSSGTQYVAFKDGANSNQMTVMKFVGSAWVLVGNAGFTTGSPYDPTLALDGNGTPYVVFWDRANSNQMTVMKFDGSAWVPVGSAGFASTYTGPSLAIDSSGTPYVAFKGNGYYDPGTVMKFNGTSWVTVGGATFTANQADYISLALNSSGTPYVVFRDGGSSNGATVVKLNGSSWETVGTAQFSSGRPRDIDLAIDATDTAYIAYYDNGNSPYRATVMKFNGTSWVNVGTPDFSEGSANGISLAFDTTGIPHVAYMDGANSYKATVMKYDDSTWVAVGGAGFSESSAGDISFAIDGNSALFVVFQDGYPTYNVTVMQNGMAPPPPPEIAENTGLTLDEGATATIDSISLKATDVNSDDASLIFTITTATINGEVQLSGSAVTTFTQGDIDSGNVTYVHDGGETTGDNFTFSVSNGSDEITGEVFSITITPVNDGPVVTGIPDVSFPEDGLYTLDLDDYAVDVDNDLSDLNWTVTPAGSGNLLRQTEDGNNSCYLFLVTEKSQAGFKRSESVITKPSLLGKVAEEGIETQTLVNQTENDTITITIDGSSHIATFTATLNYNIADVPFVFTATDPGSLSDTDTMTVTVTPVNDTLVITINTGLTVDEGSNTTITAENLSAADVESVDDSLMFLIMTNPVNGEVQLFDEWTELFTQADINAGNVTYYHYGDETTSDSFTFIAIAGSDTLYDQSFNISITTVNDAPRIIRNTGLILNGIPTAAINSSMLWIFDEESDGTALILTITEVPSYGILKNNGIDIAVNEAFTIADLASSLITYTHDGTENFNDSLTFTLSDGVNELTGQVFSIYVSQWEFVGSGGISVESVGFTSLALDGSGTPYLAYSSWTNSGKATVMKYGSAGWETVGSAGFSEGSARYTSLAIDGAGTPYLAYRDGENSDKATVMKYGSAGWETVGSAGFSEGSAATPSLAIDGNGTPYLAYSDGGNSDKATVMIYGSAGWETVGNAGISIGSARYTSLSIDGNGTLYLAYSDGGNSSKATVMKYGSAGWEPVGTNGFSAGGTWNLSLAIDGSGTPYVAYSDNENSSKATVMKYDDIAGWETVGNAGFSTGGMVTGISLAIDDSGTPYLAYAYESAGGYKNIVMKYDGFGWVTNDNDNVPGFSPAYYSGGSISLAIDNAGTPYVAYVDPNNGQPTVMKNEVVLQGIEDSQTPEEYSLSQNYPNPFNPITTFKYGLKTDSDVVLEVYNLLGQKVQTLVNERQTAGYHELQVDMSGMPSGVYLYRLQAGQFVKNKKFILLK